MAIIKSTTATDVKLKATKRNVRSGSDFDLKSIEEIRINMRKVTAQLRSKKIKLEDARAQIQAYTVMLRTVKTELDVARFVDEQNYI